jgi:hypothetical protein
MENGRHTPGTRKTSAFQILIKSQKSLFFEDFLKVGMVSISREWVKSYEKDGLVSNWERAIGKIKNKKWLKNLKESQESLFSQWTHEVV